MNDEKDIFGRVKKRICFYLFLRVDGVINSGGWQVGLIDLTVLIILVDLAS